MPEQRYIVLVTNSHKRDETVKGLVTNLTHANECDPAILVTQPALNRVEIYHCAADDIRVLIRSITVVIVPVIVNTDAVFNGLFGSVTVHANDVIDTLKTITHKLELLNGTTEYTRRGSATLTELDRGLSRLHGEY